MIKGAQKKMYVVKLGQDSPFEEAYFVLKREKDAVVGKDMVSEATNIIRQSARQPEKSKSGAERWRTMAVGFACGLLTGGGIATVICLFL